MDPISHKILKYICTKRESRLMYDILNKVHVTNPTGEKQMGKSFNITDSEWKFIYTLYDYKSVKIVNYNGPRSE